MGSAGISSTLRRIMLVLALVAAGIGAYGLGLSLRPEPEPAGTMVQHPPSVGHLELVRVDGETVRLAEVLGDTTLVFFGFTRCPDVCPITMSRLGTIYRDLDTPAGLRVLMITVDPDHDTPELLQRYVDGFHPDFVGLSGTNEQVAAAAQTFWIGYAGSGVELLHTDVVAVVDSAGALRYVYGQDALRHLPADLPGLMRRLGS
jgi:protein SCO1